MLMTQRKKGKLKKTQPYSRGEVLPDHLPDGDTEVTAETADIDLEQALATDTEDKDLKIKTGGDTTKETSEADPEEAKTDPKRKKS